MFRSGRNAEINLDETVSEADEEDIILHYSSEDGNEGEEHDNADLLLDDNTKENEDDNARESENDSDDNAAYETEDENIDEYTQFQGPAEDTSKCRLCGVEEKSKYLTNIFSQTGLKYALDMKIRKCLPIVVVEDDDMPKGVCVTCINKLDVSWELVETCLRAHFEFHTVMTHDPARARTEVLAERGEEGDDLAETGAEDLAETGAEDLTETGIDYPNETETYEYDEDDTSSIFANFMALQEPPLIIKDEPMDIEYMSYEPIEEEDSDIPTQENVPDNEPSENFSPNLGPKDIGNLSLQLMQSLQESVSNLDRSIQPIHQIGYVKIKEEPIESPPYNLILAESDAEKLSELQEPQSACTSQDPAIAIQYYQHFHVQGEHLETWSQP